MAVREEITRYACRLGQDGYYILLYGVRLKKVAALIFSDDAVPLGNQEKIRDVENVVYFPKSDYLPLVDILRNEKPLTFTYDPAIPNSAAVETIEEPTGEGERK